MIAAESQVRVAAARTGTFYGQKMTSGHLYTVAGSAASSRDGGPDGDGRPAAKAALFDAVDVAFDRSGNLLIADSGDPTDCGEETLVGSLVRVVAARTGTFYGQAMTAGDVYLVAGAGTARLGDGGPAAQALLGSASAVAVSPDGSLLVSDGGDNRLRAIAP